MALASFAAAIRAYADDADEAALPQQCRFVLIRDMSALEALGVEWSGLDQRCDDSRLGFLSFGWIHAWAKHYDEPKRELRIVAGYYRGRLAMVWPLTSRRSLGLTVLEALGEPMCQYHDVMIDPAAPASTLVLGALNALSQETFDLLRLRRVRADSALTGILTAAGARIARSQRAPFVTLAPASEGSARAAGKSRSNRRRRLRRLGETGAIAFEVAESAERAKGLIEAALALKRDWALRQGRRAPAVFDPRFEACFVDAAGSGDPHAALRVFAMLLSGRPIGVEISLAYRGRLFAHVLAHDCSLDKFGVGAALAEASIERARAQGFDTFDLLAPADGYKSEWAEGEIEVNDLALASGWRGALLGDATGRLAGAARAGMRRAPSWLMRALVRWSARASLDLGLPPR